VFVVLPNRLTAVPSFSRMRRELLEDLYGLKRLAPSRVMELKAELVVIMPPSDLFYAMCGWELPTEKAII